MTLDEPEPTQLRRHLLALRRRGVVAEVTVDNGTAYHICREVAEFKAKNSGDVGLHIRNAAKLLLAEVLPGLERGDDSARLLTVTAHIPDASARRLLTSLHELVKERARSASSEDGDATVHVLFGIAVSQET